MGASFLAEDNDDFFYRSGGKLSLGASSETSLNLTLEGTDSGDCGIILNYNWGAAEKTNQIIIGRPDEASSALKLERTGAAHAGTRFGMSENNAAQMYTDSAVDDAAYFVIGCFGAIPLHFGTNNTVALTIDASQNISIPAGNLTVSGNINPEADGTRDLGTQTTGQWANVWSELINGAEFGLENQWRLMESDLFEGYPSGFAVGYSEKWEPGMSIWHGDRQKYMQGVKPVFAVTEEFIEYRGRRITPKMLDKLLTIAGGEADSGSSKRQES